MATRDSARPEGGNTPACKDTEMLVNGVCVPKPSGFQPPPMVTCIPGYYWDDALQQCVPIVARTCPDGYELKNGECVKVVQIIPDCPAHATYINGQCVCDAGYIASGGQCVPEDQPMCVGHSHQVGNDCVCDDGYFRDVSGLCVKAPETHDCPAHAQWIDGQCVCDEGYEAKDGKCVKTDTGGGGGESGDGSLDLIMDWMKDHPIVAVSVGVGGLIFWKRFWR